jgi:hypothetical protein
LRTCTRGPLTLNSGAVRHRPSTRTPTCCCQRRRRPAATQRRACPRPCWSSLCPRRCRARPACRSWTTGTACACAAPPAHIPMLRTQDTARGWAGRAPRRAGCAAARPGRLRARRTHPCSGPPARGERSEPGSAPRAPTRMPGAPPARAGAPRGAGRRPAPAADRGAAPRARRRWWARGRAAAGSWTSTGCSTRACLPTCATPVRPACAVCALSLGVLCLQLTCARGYMVG